MGDTLSDWTGLKLSVTTTISSGNYYWLEPISVTNTVKPSGGAAIIADSRDNSEFEGYIEFSPIGSTPTASKVYIRRVTEPDEQTEDDGSVVRIEKGRTLKATYYQSGGQDINFEVELTGAVGSFVSVAAFALASCATMLVF